MRTFSTTSSASVGPLLFAHTASDVSQCIHNHLMPCSRCSVLLDASSLVYLDASKEDYYCEPCAQESGIHAYIGGLPEPLDRGH